MTFSLQRFLPALAVFCTAALGGWWIAGAGNDHSREPSRIPAPTRTERPARSKRVATLAAEPEHVRKRLAPLRAARTPDKRQRAAIHLALTLPVAELEAWYEAEWYPFRDGIDNTVFYRITRQRWLEDDPEGFMKRCLKRDADYTNESLGVWVKRDPQAAQAWLEKLENPRDLARVSQGFYQHLAKQHPLLALGEVRKVAEGTEAQGRAAIGGMLTAIAEGAGDALRREAATWPAELRGFADQALATVALKRDFAAGLAQLRGRQDGRELFLHALGHDSSLGGKLVEMADDLPEGWLAAAVGKGSSYLLVREQPARWLQADLTELGLEPRLAGQLRQSALHALAGKDPRAALGLLEQIELAPSQRLDAMHAILSQLSASRPEEARAWVAQLADPEEQKQAEAFLAGVAQRREQEQQPLTPAAWLAALANPAPGKDLHDLGSSHAERWDERAAGEARDAFAQLPDDQKAAAARALASDSAFWGVGAAMPELRADAFAWLLENPAAAAGEGGGQGDGGARLTERTSELAAWWAAEDPRAATRWVRGLPEGEARTWAMKNLARHWADYEPAAAAAWARSLPAAERAAVEEHLGRER